MSKIRDGLVRLALIVALLLPVYFLVAALGTKFGVFDWRVGFGLLVFKLGSLALMIAFGLGVLALLLALLVKPRRGWVLAMVAILIPALALAFAASVGNSAKTLPPIHDIATDVQDPPEFSAAVKAARTAVPGGNGVESMTAPMKTLKVYATPRMAALADKTVGGLGQAANPDITSLTLEMPVAAATTLAASVASKQGLKVGRVSPAEGAVEAVAESFWFGFKDDVAIRVRPGPDGDTSVVDVRSSSRVGLSDLGANARRVRGLLTAIKAEAGKAEG
ncbi:MAG: DUF1499 domain-containing protein [Caulobacter sp.]|nr:DUF1499 domain-containing protein [Caulobacter sp.]